jgi:hypothetical protein
VTPVSDDQRPADVERMQAIYTGLHAAGLDAHVHNTKGVLDITAIARRASAKDTEVTVDDDGYVVVSYWNDSGATPAQVVAIISQILAVIGGSS